MNALTQKTFADEYEAFKEELQGYYATYPIPVPHVEERIDQLDKLNPSATSYEKKAFIYQAAAERCEVQLFRHCSLFYEIQAGRARNGVTKGFPPEPGIGGWLMRKNDYMESEYEGWHRPYDDDLVLLTLFFADFSHYAVACDNILREGLKGLLTRAQQKLFEVENEKEKGFLNAVTTGLNSLITIAHKFGDKAKEMLETEEDPTVIRRLERIAAAAYNVPENPAATYYEALNTIWFMKELAITMEGVGQAILGHIDRLLLPYYEADLREGRMTREEAKDLLAEFLAITDSKWDIYDDIAMGGVNTTVVVGGCDAQGKVVFNDITRMVFEIYDEYKLVNPKLQVRVSQEHPEEYFDLISQTAAKGLNVMSIFNDEVMIAAHVKMGKAVEDARLYVAGGCQEPVLANTEINVRAYCYINLPKMINDTIDPSKNAYWSREGIQSECGADSATYEEFYDCVKVNMGKTFESLVNNYNRLQDKWTEYSPCPLYSATITGCIENTKDMTEGGAKYNYNSLSPVGIGTFIDSLFAIKKVVFEEKMLTLKELHACMDANYEGNETIRQHLLNSVEKYGDDVEELNRFAAQISDDIARLSSGMPNNRGGVYEPSLFSNFGYLNMKEYGATADGRKRGQILSRGVGPSDQGGAAVISKILRGIKPMDMSNYPGGAVLYLDMPYSQDNTNPDIYKFIVKYFIANGGNILDINTMNVETLQDARVHPEDHKNLVVRVWGFSAYYVTLDEDTQDEMIKRMLKV